MDRRSNLGTDHLAEGVTLTVDLASAGTGDVDTPTPRSGPRHAAPSRWARRRAGRGRRRWPVVVPVVVVVGLVVGAVVQLARPVPPPTLRFDAARSVVVGGRSPLLSWPAQGQGAVAVPELGLWRASGPEVPVPVASVTKMMTAYVVLQRHPLGPDDQGPSLTLTAADQSEADADADADDASVPVQAGEQLSERQLLDGLMVPSADNLADVLATWVSGTAAAFVATMNATAAGLGLRHTHYSDPAGLDPTTVSTAADSLRLAAVAMRLPAFAAIVDQHTATLPVAGLVTNPARSIGVDGFVGIKSGFTNAAQGCLVLATLRPVDGHPVLVMAAVTGQGGLDPLEAADTATRALIASVAGALEPYSLLKAGAVMGTERASWGASTTARTAGAIRTVVEPGEVVHIAVVRSRWRGMRSGTVVVSEGGHVVLTQRLRTGPLSAPSWWWRLLHG